MSFTLGGNILKPEAVRICVLYDPSNGRIVHTHEVVTLPGGRKVDEKEMERRTLQRAASAGVDTSKLKVMHVPPEEYDRTSLYRVELKGLRLVKLARPDKSKPTRRARASRETK